jgi:hypothetical protein
VVATNVTSVPAANPDAHPAVEPAVEVVIKGESVAQPFDAAVTMNSLYM